MSIGKTGKVTVRMDRQLERVRKAYDLTVEQYHKGIGPLDSVPEDIKNSLFYKSLAEDKSVLNSGSLDVKEYLNPESGKRFLDAGCSANLVNYRLDRWPSIYYGVDISPALISAMKNFVSREHITIGGLYLSDLSGLPFDDDFFDISAVIGVMEYCSLEYIKTALSELKRVLKAESAVVLDIPNQHHLYANDMAKLEKHLKRPIFLHSRARFEELLEPQFSIERVDDSSVMLKYFLRTR
jgi:ubiquinone/menaquinone biosynthesis C-methylase UbiE